MALWSSDTLSACLCLLGTNTLDKSDFFLSMQQVVINLFIVYSIIVMPTLYIKFCGPSIDGVNQEACDFHSNITVMNLNLSMYFKAVCHRHVWWFT